MNKNKMRELVSLYESNIDYYKLNEYNETEVRTDFINKFFEILGWDVNNVQGLPQDLREVKQEANVLVEENDIHRIKKPDYLFKINKENKFYLEAKKPHVDIVTDESSAYQTRRYGWSGNLKISVLTNFNDLIIYDCSIRPIEGDLPNKAIIAKYNYKDYFEKFDEIYEFLSKESVLNGTFEKKFESINNSVTKEQFDEYFLNQIRTWRKTLANDIFENNQEMKLSDIEVYVQRLLNKILFLRICEDRNIEQYEQIKKIKNFNELKKLFENCDKKFDSGIFELLEDKIIVSDETIINIFKELYYPNSSYDFSVVDTYILGQIYDLFLTEEISVEDSKIKYITKTEIADANGAVTTPKYIANKITKEALVEKTRDYTMEELRKIKIGDICCGSGVFLISAYENLCDIYIEKMSNDKNNYLGKELIEIDKHLVLTYQCKRYILENNIYGVDIDYIAVEVAKLGLLLKLIENEDSETLKSYSLITKNKILPNINNNIKCGNSLVDFNFLKYSDVLLENPELFKKINIFDWNSEFFENNCKKFDIIVGNPPYTRVQKMAEYIPEEYNYYKSSQSHYLTINAIAPDKYYLFIERAFSLIENDGIIDFIVPNKFMNNTSGKNLRRLISEKKALHKVYHFKDNQIFKGRLTYCCILQLKKNTDNFQFKYIEDLNEFKYSNNIEMDHYSSKIISDEPWNISIDESVNVSSNEFDTLESVATIFVGVQTSNDKVYIIKSQKEDEEYVYFNDFNGVHQKIEKSILKNGIYDLQLNRYNKIKPNVYFIFPYYYDKNKVKLIRKEDLINKFPFAYRYLKKYEELLKKRKINNMNEENWYQYGRSQSLSRFSGNEHLIWTVLLQNANYVYDNESIMFSGGGNGPYYGLEVKKETKESIFYIQALLNHKFLSERVKSVASIFNGGYYSYGKQYVKTLPIRKINFNNIKEKNLHDKIVGKTQKISELITDIENEVNPHTINMYKRIIDENQREINSLIDILYNLGGKNEE